MVTKSKYPVEQRAEAVALAAGSSTAAAAKSLGLPYRTLAQWVQQTDPAEIQALAAEKRARATQKVLEHVEEVAEGIMVDLKTVGLDDKAAKALQARATTLGIMDDHFGGRQMQTDTGRYGTRAPDDHLERLGRLAVERLEQRALEQPPLE